MFCYQCGVELPDGAQFCNNCGVRQPTAAASPEGSANTGSANTGSSANGGGAQRSGSVIPQKVVVNFIKGSGWTVFSMTLGGYLAVSDAGVSYTGLLGSGNDHSYPFESIQRVSFEMTHLGLQPVFGYMVYLKSGEKYKYGYSPFFKSQLESIDAVIKSKMT